MTMLVLLLTGWIVVPEVTFAPAPARATRRLATPVAVNYGRAR
jgi:hypothetical protein